MLVMLCIQLLCTAATAAAADIAAPLVLGYSDNVFYNVDPRDAIALTKAWARMADRKIGPGADTSVVEYKSFSDIENALAKNEVDILIMLPEELIRLRDRYKLAPILSSDYGKHFYNELILLVRSDVGISSIEQLRGKKLILDVGQKGGLPRLWLESLIMERVTASVKAFFGSISESTKPSQAVMPVFFRNADACLVSRSSYETMVEMNPQFGRQLKVLERSPGFVTGVLAVRKDDAHNPRRDAMQKALQEMYTYQSGKQLLTLFRINRLVPFLPEHLANIEKVLKEHQGKTGASAQRKK